MYRPGQWVNHERRLDPNWRQCPVRVLAPEDRTSVQCPSFQSGTTSRLALAGLPVSGASVCLMDRSLDGR